MKFKLLRKIITVASTFLFALVMTGTIIAWENVGQINSALNTSNFEPYEIEGGEEVDTEYYKSEYNSVGELTEAGWKKAEEAEAEGAVLLKNENNALPLAKNSNVSLVGVTAYNPVYGGTGSGSLPATYQVTFEKSLTDAGLNLNTTLGDKYKSEEWAKYKRSTSGSYGTTQLMINGAPWSVVNEAAGDSFATYGDAAIFILGRVGGEGYDLIRKGGDAIDENDGLGMDYLGLTQNEIDTLKGLKAKKDAGDIKKIIVLINYAGMLEGSFINDPAYGIDACMWIGATGGGNAAVGKLLTGEYNPSGRLPDTMWMNNAMNPVNVNYQASLYEGAENFGVSTQLGTGNYPEYTLSAYVVYQEGMYLGYRYTETRYEDVVLGTQNVGDYDYEEVVAYPFGYGSSYTTFETSAVSVKKTGDRDYTVSVTVKNTGDKAGKYSVPVWVSKPYDDYARENKIQVPSVELVDFLKTDLLEPNASDTYSVVLDEKFFASYDAWGAEGYILMDGDYYVAVGGSAHDAVNNVLKAKQANGVTIDESKMVGTGDATKVEKFELSFDANKYQLSDETSMIDGRSNMRITNLFDFSDINRYEGRGNNSVEYYSRDAWNKVSFDMTNGHPKLQMTEQMAREIFEQVPEGSGNYNNMPSVPDKYKQPIESDNGQYPTYGKAAGLQLIDMRYDENGDPISFFDPIWDTFMDQITWDETVEVLGDAWHRTIGIASVTKPDTRDENGPQGFNWVSYTAKTGLGYRTEAAKGHIDAEGNLTAEADPDLSQQKPMGFPCNGIIAASFNKTLAYEVGKIIGENGIWTGTAGLYGTGLNIHRSPYLGRTCEYYSECGTLSGLIAAEECRAIEGCGVHVYNKHCALNDMENNRHGVGTWLPEQALREIYLRAFELPITKGGAFNTMASFSRFGTYSGAACKELGVYFLRGECGMRGVILTDAYGDMDGSQNIDPYYEQVYGVLMGSCDLPDGQQPGNGNHFDKFKTGYSEMAWAMRLSVKRLCYATAWSCAMNGYSSNTRMRKVMPWWQTTLIVVDVALGVVAAGGLIWTAAALYVEKKDS